MPLIDRVRMTWTGFPGAPGVTTVYGNSGPLLTRDLEALATAVVPYLPQQVQLSLPIVGDTLDVATGELRSTWSTTPGSPGPGFNAGAYAAPVGAQIQWISDTIIGGRKLVGKTFFVPLLESAFELDGTLSNPFVAAMGTAAAAMIASHPGNFLVYRRPAAATPSWTDVRGVLHEAKPAHAGYSAPVVAYRIPDTAVVLRSRRD